MLRIGDGLRRCCLRLSPPAARPLGRLAAAAAATAAAVVLCGAWSGARGASVGVPLGAAARFCGVAATEVSPWRPACLALLLFGAAVVCWPGCLRGVVLCCLLACLVVCGCVCLFGCLPCGCWFDFFFICGCGVAYYACLRFTFFLNSIGIWLSFKSAVVALGTVQVLLKVKSVKWIVCSC